MMKDRIHLPPGLGRRLLPLVHTPLTHPSSRQHARAMDDCQLSSLFSPTCIPGDVSSIVLLSVRVCFSLPPVFVILFHLSLLYFCVRWYGHTYIYIDIYPQHCRDKASLLLLFYFFSFPSIDINEFLMPDASQSDNVGRDCLLLYRL